MRSLQTTTSFRRHTSLAAVFASLLRCRGGIAAVEFALVAPALLLLVFGIVEFGLALWKLNALHYSVETAARCASINAVTCPTADQVQAFAAGSASAGFDPSVFQVELGVGCGNQVSASYTMPLYIPFANYSVTLTAQSCYPI